MSDGFLIDTHVAIWLAEGRLGDDTFSQIVDAGLEKRCFISPVTAWEVGLLARRRRYSFDPDAETWLAHLRANPALVETPLTTAILFSSNFLPGEFHADPADRMLIATARALAVPLMTRDAAIHTYAAQGHVAVVSC